MDAPGVKAENIDIRISDNLLTIRGKREEDKDRTDHRIGPTRGALSRTIALRAQVDARYCDGILTVATSKTAEAQAHMLKVTV